MGVEILVGACTFGNGCMRGPRRPGQCLLYHLDGTLEAFITDRVVCIGILVRNNTPARQIHAIAQVPQLGLQLSELSCLRQRDGHLPFRLGALFSHLPLRAIGEFATDGGALTCIVGAHAASDEAAQ